MARSKRIAKQSRLAFNPLTSSDPAGVNAIQEHGLRSYAMVGLEGRHGKYEGRKKTSDEHINSAETGNMLLTPGKSSQHQHGSIRTRASSNTEVGNTAATGSTSPFVTRPAKPDRSSQPVIPKSRKRKRIHSQSRLDFSNHIGVHLDQSDEYQSETDDQATRINSQRPFIIGNDDEDSEMPRNSKLRPTLHANGIFGTQPPKPTEDSDSSDEPFLVGSAKKKSPRKKVKRGVMPPSPEEDSDANNDVFVANNAPVDKSVDRHLQDNDDSDGPPEIKTTGSPSLKSTPLKRLRRGTNKKDESSIKTRSSSSRHKPIHIDTNKDSEDEVATKSKHRNTRPEFIDALSETSGDDAAALHSTPPKSRKTRKSNVDAREDAFVVSDDEIEWDDPVSEDDIHAANSEDEEEGEEVTAQPARRGRLIRRRPRQLTEQEEEDLHEDLDFLQSSPPGVTAKVKVTPSKASNRLALLTQLKNKRAAKDVSSSSALLPDILEATSDQETEDEVDEGEDGDIGAAVADQEDVENFIDDDDDGLGVPDAAREIMPLWATGFTTMKAKSLFKFAVEWMVQKKLNPGFSQDRQEYNIAFRKLNDEVKGLSGSKYTSSAWVRDFTVALQARPTIETQSLSFGLSTDPDFGKCEACNRSGHPASYTIQFLGAPYNPDDLEDIDQGFSSSEDNDNLDDDDDEPNALSSSRIEHDYKGRAIPSSARIYHVGSVCASNAATAHQLEHWKLSLRQAVIEQLDKEGHMSHRRIIKREQMSEKKRRKYADKVIEDWVSGGQVKKLYQTFRESIDEAKDRDVGWRTRETLF